MVRKIPKGMFLFETNFTKRGQEEKIYYVELIV